MKRGKFIPINTLDDLTSLVNCSNRAIDKRLNKLTRRNRKLTVLAVASICYAICAYVERRKQEEQVYQLSVRVKKLERREGE